VRRAKRPSFSGCEPHHYATDAVAEAHAMVMLVESGFAQQTEVVQAFGKSGRTVRRHQERYAHYLSRSGRERLHTRAQRGPPRLAQPNSGTMRWVDRVIYAGIERDRARRRRGAGKSGQIARQLRLS
jgi:hypothetical protein